MAKSSHEGWLAMNACSLGAALCGSHTVLGFSLQYLLVWLSQVLLEIVSRAVNGQMKRMK